MLLAGLVCPAGNRKGMRGTQEQSKRKTNNHLAMEIWKSSTERCSWKPRDCQREGLEASQREEARAPPWEAPCCLRSGQGHGQPWPTLSTHPTFAFEKHKQTLGTRVFATQHTPHTIRIQAQPLGCTASGEGVSGNTREVRREAGVKGATEVTKDDGK